MYEPRTTQAMENAMKAAHQERARAFQGAWTWLFTSR